MSKQSISDLAREIKQALKPEFDSINKRFDEQDKKFDGIDKRFDGIDKRFDGIDKRVDGIDKRLDFQGQRLNSHDKRFDSILETLREFRRESFEHYDRIYNRLDFFKDEYYAITSGMKRIEDEHRIIDHSTILKEIQALRSKNQVKNC